jgi:hypothetical protein
MPSARPAWRVVPQRRRRSGSASRHACTDWLTHCWCSIIARDSQPLLACGLLPGSTNRMLHARCAAQAPMSRASSSRAGDAPASACRTAFRRAALVRLAGERGPAGGGLPRACSVAAGCSGAGRGPPDGLLPVSRPSPSWQLLGAGVHAAGALPALPARLSRTAVGDDGGAAKAEGTSCDTTARWGPCSCATGDHPTAETILRAGCERGSLAGLAPATPRGTRLRVLRQ